MIDFKTLMEAGNNPVDINWKKGENWVGEFELEDSKFIIHISKNNDYCKTPVYEFKFTRDNSVKMINDFKYPFRVVPTFQKAMDDFLSEVKPSIVGFVANKDDKSRLKMYEKNAKLFASKHDYLLHLDFSSDFFAYVLYNDSKLEDCVKELESVKWEG